ncbi:hypothetical protein BOTBODRAFT_220756 [Botryobasidium botryosum FD-172 SS1]|uniref:Secreted protein n=1 Tax=Botryobasidium botryosum (strain FD-172 SS1) TaxID=930990 RepID=A0A067MN29_BOTB1|nr:hypothetical protein BOTBODRAFT_220756 [Botryobasidium botryosum FD-172 SS1]
MQLQLQLLSFLIFLFSSLVLVNVDRLLTSSTAVANEYPSTIPYGPRSAASSLCRCVATATIQPAASHVSRASTYRPPDARTSMMPSVSAPIPALSNRRTRASRARAPMPRTRVRRLRGLSMFVRPAESLHSFIRTLSIPQPRRARLFELR